MADNYYNQQLGLVDGNGNLTQKGKINRVLAVAGRFHVNAIQAEDALKLYNWDMEGALDYLAIANPNLRQYLYKHRAEAQSTLYTLPSEEQAKWFKEHESTINTVGNIAEAGSNIFAYLVMGAFIFLLACFGL